MAGLLRFLTGLKDNLNYQSKAEKKIKINFCIFQELFKLYRISEALNQIIHKSKLLDLVPTVFLALCASWM